MSITFTWDGTNNAWASDHWGRSGVAPKWPGDTGTGTNSTVSIPTGRPPNTAAPTLTCQSYYQTVGVVGSSLDTQTANITVTANLTMGDSFGLAPACVWAGNASVVSGAVLAGSARNTGSLGDYAGFYDDAQMTDGTAGDYAVFQDGGCGMSGGTVGDYANFYGGSSMNGGTLGDYATFHDECWIGNGTVGEQASFNDDAEAFDLSIGAGAAFNGSAFVYPDGGTTITLPVAIRTTFTGWGTYLAGSGSVNLYGDGTNSITYDLTICIWDNPNLVCEYPWVAVLCGIILIYGGDVRSGNARYDSNVTGTLSVPDSTDVLTGVAVDDTTGSLRFRPRRRSTAARPMASAATAARGRCTRATCTAARRAGRSPDGGNPEVGTNGGQRDGHAGWFEAGSSRRLQFLGV